MSDNRGVSVRTQVLDLHCNELSKLPEAMEELQSLQVLNVEQNKLKSLPAGIGKLQRLQTLLLKGRVIPMGLIALQ